MHPDEKNAHLYINTPEVDQSNFEPFFPKINFHSTFHYIIHFMMNSNPFCQIVFGPTVNLDK